MAIPVKQVSIYLCVNMGKFMLYAVKLNIYIIILEG